MIKREKAFKIILVLIILLWLFSYFYMEGFYFWSGFAGALTIPLLLAALAVDNLLKD